MKIEALHKYQPFVWFTPLAWQKIQLIVDECDEEVGWWGTVEDLTQRQYLITDVFIPEQEVDPSNTDVGGDELAKLGVELHNQGIDTDTLTYWGHSHVNMKATPSWQDKSQSEDYSEHIPFLLQGTHNKKGDLQIDLYDFAASVKFVDVDTSIYIPTLPEEIKEEVKTSLEERVRSAPKQVQVWKGYTYETDDEFVERLEADWAKGKNILQYERARYKRITGLELN